jgi:hypothetical protein
LTEASIDAAASLMAAAASSVFGAMKRTKENATKNATLVTRYMRNGGV